MQIETLPAALFAAAEQLWRQTGLTRPWNDPAADLRRALAGQTSTILAARSSTGALLGTAMVGHDGHRGWVYYLAVQPGRRREGVGRELMCACEEWLRQRDVPKIQLMVRHANEGAVGFYEELGYVDAEVVVLGRFLHG